MLCFFFKQKTANEMRISDWSSDVCSSDLSFDKQGHIMETTFTPISALIGGILIGLSAVLLMLTNGRIAGISGIVGGLLAPQSGETGWRKIGRAAFRDRVCQYM